jgi:hypothetical protein
MPGELTAPFDQITRQPSQHTVEGIQRNRQLVDDA